MEFSVQTDRPPSPHQGIPWQGIYFSPWRDCFSRGEIKIKPWPCLAGSGKIKITPWPVRLALAETKSRHGWAQLAWRKKITPWLQSQASSCQDRPGSTPQHVLCLCVRSSVGRKIPQAKNPVMAASLASEIKIRSWLGPAGPAKKKSGHGSGWLAELTNCHDLIFISAKNPAAGNFAMGRMPWWPYGRCAASCHFVRQWETACRLRSTGAASGSSVI